MSLGRSSLLLRPLMIALFVCDAEHSWCRDRTPKSFLRPGTTTRRNSHHLQTSRSDHVRGFSLGEKGPPLALFPRMQADFLFSSARRLHLDAALRSHPARECGYRPRGVQAQDVAGGGERLCASRRCARKGRTSLRLRGALDITRAVFLGSSEVEAAHPVRAFCRFAAPRSSLGQPPPPTNRKCSA